MPLAPALATALQLNRLEQIIIAYTTDNAAHSFKLTGPVRIVILSDNDILHDMV